MRNRKKLPAFRKETNIEMGGSLAPVVEHIQLTLLSAFLGTMVFGVPLSAYTGEGLTLLLGGVLLAIPGAVFSFRKRAFTHPEDPRLSIYEEIDSLLQEAKRLKKTDALQNEASVTKIVTLTESLRYQLWKEVKTEKISLKGDFSGVDIEMWEKKLSLVEEGVEEMRLMRAAELARLRAYNTAERLAVEEAGRTLEVEVGSLKERRAITEEGRVLLEKYIEETLEAPRGT